jgi:SAM-dependent methyltransferase
LLEEVEELSEYTEKMRDYWNERFEKESLIWGTNPSVSARQALDIFKRHEASRLLVPGSGYGRNTRYFSAAGMRVVGVEISDAALKQAKDFDPHTTFYHMSVLDIHTLKERFTAVYCFNVLHLFRRAERQALVQKCARVVEPGGVLYFVVFSEKEEKFGKGKMVEENTFESKPGRPVHYFTEHDLKDHFKEFDLLEVGILEDRENHGEEGEHTHVLRYLACLQPKSE